MRARIGEENSILLSLLGVLEAWRMLAVAFGFDTCSTAFIILSVISE